MKKSVKIWLIVAASLVLLGAIVFFYAMTALQWNFSGSYSNNYETNEHEISDSFSSISINTDTADIKFLPLEASNNAACLVVCQEQSKMKHTVKLNGSVLEIALEDTRKWYEHIGIGFESSEITVYLKAGVYGSLLIESDTGDVELPKDFVFESIEISESTGDVRCSASALEKIKISASTGDVHLEGLSAESVAISTSTGDISAFELKCRGELSLTVTTGKSQLDSVDCVNLTTDGSTGSISLNDVIVQNRLTLERSTGDVMLDGCDAGEIFIKTDTGDVEGTLLSEKVFLVKTDTGDVKVPSTLTGGICEITTDTGDVNITIK